MTELGKKLERLQNLLLKLKEQGVWWHVFYIDTYPKNNPTKVIVKYERFQIVIHGSNANTIPRDGKELEIKNIQNPQGERELDDYIRRIENKIQYNKKNEHFKILERGRYARNMERCKRI